MKTKYCPKCEQKKAIFDFYQNRTRYDGRQAHCKQCKGIWDKEHPVSKEIKQLYNARCEVKNKQNPIKRLHNNIRRVVNYVLKKNKQGRRTFEILGYSVESLKKHLENQFADGMSWRNYGKWHIDHIIPVSFFKFISPDDVEFKMCWRLENLRPLWAKDNLKKSNKLSPMG